MHPGQETGNGSHGELTQVRISKQIRFVLASAGLSSWLAGGAASFLSTNGAGAAALIGVGGAACVLAFMGRWPSRVSMSGNEVSWGDVKATLDSQIQAASDDDAGELAELRNLRDRLAVLQTTGTIPDHPAQVYDQEVMAAIRRLLPGAEIIPHQQGKRSFPDFIVCHDSGNFFVETKWRADPTQPMRGSTLPQLIQGLPGDAKLLVISNSSVPPAPSADQVLRDALGDRGRVETWLSAEDDGKLRVALDSLLAGNGPVSSRLPKGGSEDDR